LLDSEGLENPAVVAQPHLVPSPGIRDQTLQQSKLAQQLHLVYVEFLGLENLWAAWPRVHEDHPSTLLAQHGSESRTCQARSYDNDLGRDVK